MTDLELVRKVTKQHPCCGCCAGTGGLECTDCGGEVYGYECSPFNAELCIYCCPVWSETDPDQSRWLDDYRLQISMDAHIDRRAAIAHAKKDY
jgi:hypothetical protein